MGEGGGFDGVGVRAGGRSVLTVDMDRMGVGRGTVVLDVGAGRGRHTFEAARRGARVVAVDLSGGDLREVQGLAAAMTDAGECARDAIASLQANALSLPFSDRTFDVVVASEVLEHIDDDRAAMSEIARVLKPGGKAAVTVPRWGPERVCWTLSRAYRSQPGGHVRIYRRSELTVRLRETGLRNPVTHHAHALHSPYWWLKCLWGIDNERAKLPSFYHRFLVWDITAQPRVTRMVEKALNPVMGKSLVVYVEREPTA